MSRAAPTVGVVVVNYGGGPLTIDCLHSVLRSDWSAGDLRVVLVDNPVDDPMTTDGVADRVARELPEVRVVRSTSNVGFAGGCNLGIRALPDTDFVALVNNDATVSPGWLEPLVQTLHADGSRGAACPKILFASPYVDVSIHSSTRRRGRGDRRDLGVRLSGSRVDSIDTWTRTQFVDGFWGSEAADPDEAGMQWTSAVARLRVPVTADEGTHVGALRLAADTPTTVSIRSGDAERTVEVGTTPEWHEIPLRGAAIEILNNAGTIVGADGYASDRGFLEPDDGSFDAPVDVDAWCGAAVLLTRSYLDDVGQFDERLFLYYEDVELSLRGRARGWRYRFVPESVVRHVHSASSIEGSPLARYYNERNRLLVLARHASFARLITATGRALLVTGSYARRDVVSPMLHGRRPRADVVAGRLRAIAGFVRLASEMRRTGRHD